MPVTRIDALCICEGCGKRFGVELELAEDSRPAAAVLPAHANRWPVVQQALERFGAMAEKDR